MLDPFKKYPPSTVVGLALTFSAFFIIAFYLPSVLFSLSGKSEILIVQGQESKIPPVELWWPQNNVSLQGRQIFKALVRNEDALNYSLSWQLDDGAEVAMANSDENFAHKEASVDVSGWTWNGKGPYSLTFRARDSKNNLIASSSVIVYRGAGSTSAQEAALTSPSAENNTRTHYVTHSIEPSSQAANLATTPLSSLFGKNSLPLNSTVKTPVPVTKNAGAISSPTTTIEAAATIQQAQQTINVWWPLDATQVSGTQPLKAIVQGRDISTYRMFWQVDGGTQNELGNSSVDYQHKEYLIDFSGWNWHGSGPYSIHLIAKDSNNTILASKTITVFTGENQPLQTVQTSVTSVSAVPASTSTQTTAPLSVITSPMNPFKNQTLFINSVSSASTQATLWQASRPADATLMQKISAQPVASWFGNWNTSIASDVKTYIAQASQQNTLPVLVSYNIPQRDCGGYSAGGADSADAYKAWIDQFAGALGTSKVVIVLEPDSLAQSSCLSSTDLSRRFDLLTYAVSAFKSHANTAVYVDAGHSGWIDANEMANLLKQAGIKKADGFALNVSNFVSTTVNAAYGKQISSLLGGTHFIIDTSRNGTGGNGQWCNPSDQALGNSPTTSTGDPLIDAYLWIKTPGESDGTCNGGPSAGTWWPEYALNLAKKAGW